MVSQISWTIMLVNDAKIMEYTLIALNTTLISSWKVK